VSARDGSRHHRANQAPTDQAAPWAEDRTTTTYQSQHIGVFAGADALVKVARDPVLQFASARVPEALRLSEWQPASRRAESPPRASGHAAASPGDNASVDVASTYPRASVLALCLASVVAGAGLFGAVLLGQVVIRATRAPAMVDAAQAQSEPRAPESERRGPGDSTDDAAGRSSGAQP
jgi:hypothetical protein